MGITPEEVKTEMNEQIASVERFLNTPHDGGPGWAHESAKEDMFIKTCLAVAKTFQAELERVAEIEDSHGVEELTEEMKDWDAIDDSIEWNGIPAPNTGGSNVIWGPDAYTFVVRNSKGEEAWKKFTTLQEFMAFIDAVDTIGSVNIHKDSKGRWSLWVK